MTHVQEIRRCLAHYQAKLLLETKQFRVKMVEISWVRHSSYVLSSHSFWQKMTEQLDDHYQIIDHGQNIGLIVSESPIPRPKQYFDLWVLVNRLQDHLADGTGNNIQDAIEDLLYYDGPYRIEPEFTDEVLS
jgi:hypothetical protein